MSKTSTGLEANIAGLLCYLLGWVTGIIFLLIEKEDKTVRFHAWQSIIVFGALNVLIVIFNFIPLLGIFITWILSIVAFILWVVLMFKAYKGESYKIPVVGDIAEKQVK